jgi:DNA mismatch endonuclease, patch repair protein
MGRIKSKDTEPELIVRSVLHKHGFRFRLHVDKLPGKPDIVLPKFKIIIFVHGCFWHSHGCKNSKIPYTKYNWWKDKLESNVSRDKKNSELLVSMGWNVLVVWECEFRRVSQSAFVESEERLIKRIRSIIDTQ